MNTKLRGTHPDLIIMDDIEDGFVYPSGKTWTEIKEKFDTGTRISCEEALARLDKMQSRKPFSDHHARMLGATKKLKRTQLIDDLLGEDK